jgi:hypothetical protein
MAIAPVAFGRRSGPRVLRQDARYPGAVSAEPFLIRAWRTPVVPARRASMRCNRGRGVAVGSARHGLAVDRADRGVDIDEQTRGSCSGPQVPCLPGLSTDDGVRLVGRNQVNACQEVPKVVGAITRCPSSWPIIPGPQAVTVADVAGTSDHGMHQRRTLRRGLNPPARSAKRTVASMSAPRPGGHQCGHQDERGVGNQAEIFETTFTRSNPRDTGFTETASWSCDNCDFDIAIVPCREAFQAEGRPMPP